MIQRPYPFLVATVAAIALAACSPEAPPAPPQTDDARTETEATQAQPGANSSWSTDPADDPNAYVPTEVAADAVLVGSSRDASGRATGAKPVYAQGDTVHASAPLKGAQPGAKFDVYWTFQDGQTHKMESKTGATGDYVSFEFASADGMVAGNYNVQIDANGIPLGIAEFRVE
ncbi:hypothetical protein CNR27_14845 [Luteimonas chenhongjianii]|uniref:PKD domain-containing protein n=1 Tax=Luteimonas chenhongjianii TaxID=2006110 RepID=A0A290XHB8_9GAMM|nr:hypothetical protein [Luteimonas chenhongjianii]ATD68554.1 hypothetical protein CNR27_14845 [Luteimonas chenhongjianii]